MPRLLTTKFFSLGRGRVLEVLQAQTRPIALRQLAALSGLAVHTIELALKELVREKIVKRKVSGREVCFELNKEHEDYSIWMALFAVSERHLLQRRADSYTHKMQSVLSFISSGAEMIGVMKSQLSQQ